jgi:translation initiation factor 3 subunit F
MDTQKPLSLPGSAPYENVLISPVVVFNILDHFVRRGENQARVIGTLLGTINEEDGSVVISNSYPVPHTETEQVVVNMEFHRNMMALYKKIAPDEVIVGWYATGSRLYDTSQLIHNFYWREMNAPPVHLLVTVPEGESTAKPTMGKRAAVTDQLTVLPLYSQQLALSDRGTLQEQFHPLNYQLLTGPADRVAFDALTSELSAENVDANAPLKLSDLATLEHAVTRVLQYIDQVHDYLSRVVDGKEQTPSAEVGRLISDTLALLPHSEPNFEKIFTHGLQDVLMLVYLANLTRTHLLLAEKLRDQTSTL